MKNVLATLTILFFVHSAVHAGTYFIREEQVSSSIKTILSPEKGKMHKNKMLKGGFTAQLGCMVPLKNYFFVNQNVISVFAARVRPGPVLEIGQLFRLFDLEPLALGIRATWASGGFGSISITGTTIGRAINITAGRVGPYVCYQLGDETAVEAYFQAGMSYLTAVNKDFSDLKFDPGYGFGYEFGACHRFNRYSLGVSYSWGGLPSGSWSNDAQKAAQTLPSSNLRFLLGVKL